MYHVSSFVKRFCDVSVKSSDKSQKYLTLGQFKEQFSSLWMWDITLYISVYVINASCFLNKSKYLTGSLLRSLIVSMTTANYQT